MAMHAGLFRFESHRLAEFSRPFSGRTAKGAVETFRSHPVWLPAILIAGLGGWIVISGHADNSPGNRAAAKTDVAAIAVAQPAPPHPAGDVAQFDPATAPAEAAPVNGLRISSQSWRRGGLGSKALVTFTLRNDNDYAVGDIGLLCSFSRADGSPVTERRQTIRDTVNMKSRKTFARVHVGFVHVNANRAKCSLLSASRV
jgi:hypothetical protein